MFIIDSCIFVDRTYKIIQNSNMSQSVQIDHVFDNFAQYKGWEYYEDEQWKPICGIFGILAEDSYCLEFGNIVETSNVSYLIKKGDFVRIRQNSDGGTSASM